MLKEFCKAGAGSPVCWNEEQLQLLIDAITASGGGGGSGPFVTLSNSPLYTVAQFSAVHPSGILPI